MVDYRRMGNMVRHLESATSTTSMHHLRDLWKSPRGTVLRIQALAVMGIIIAFFLAAFGSCRRWSNRWIVQNGFFAAHVLSLSLGTYSIGLMQSSSVKSEMYPIWTISLFTLFGCIDPVTAYNGLDYKGPLSKTVYQIFLYSGYVLLMSISTISSGVGSTAIGMLSAITFIKGFHRSLALMQQNRMRNMVRTVEGDRDDEADVLSKDPTCRERAEMTVDFPLDPDDDSWDSEPVTLKDINDVLTDREEKDKLWACYDMSVAFGLSHKLQQYFLKVGYREPEDPYPEDTDCKWALKVIEIELAFLYEIFFTGNAFLHYYQAKTASLWALASLIGICFVGVAAAIPGTLGSHHTSSGTGGCTSVVHNTTADLVITFVILVSLALLQLMQLIRCWTSNFARVVAVACAYARDGLLEPDEDPWWMRLKLLVATSTNWFDKHLWQDRIKQYSVLPDEGRFIAKIRVEGRSKRKCMLLFSSLTSIADNIYHECARLFKKLRVQKGMKMLGLDYIGEVLWDLLGSDTNKRAAVRLDEDVKASIIDFLGQIKDNISDGNWISFPNHPDIKVLLPYFGDHIYDDAPLGFRYAEYVMKWHVATWCCELLEQMALSKMEEQRTGCKETAASYYLNRVAGCFRKPIVGGGESEDMDNLNRNRNRHVANVLSKYCAYLVESSPELLPGPPPVIKEEYDSFRKDLLDDIKEECFEENLRCQDNMNSYDDIWSRCGYIAGVQLACLLQCIDHGSFQAAVNGHCLSLFDSKCRSDLWETLALVWVRMLVYAAPYGNAEAHMQRLRQGGEFITHLWALLYHLGMYSLTPR